MDRCRQCVHFSTWQENQAPYGSGYNWPETFYECNAEAEDQAELDNCSAFEELPKCAKHPDQMVWHAGSMGMGDCFECENEILEELYGDDV